MYMVPFTRKRPFNDRRKEYYKFPGNINYHRLVVHPNSCDSLSSHPMGNSMKAQGNQVTDLATEQATTRELNPKACVSVVPLLKLPKFSETELTWIGSEGATDKNR